MALLGFPLGHRPDSKAEKVRKSASKEKIKDSGKGKEKVSGTKPYKPYGHLLFVCLFVPLLLLIYVIWLLQNLSPHFLLVSEIHDVLI